MARKVGDRAAEACGKVFGTVTEVHEVLPGVFEYGIAWDDGDYAGETWNERDLYPASEDQ